MPGLRGMIVGLLLALGTQVAAQYPRRPADRPVRVEAEGVLRWADDGAEVALFGVNYYAPFSLDYANLKQLGADHRRAIDDDLAHLHRLGLDALRLHVFDREISDAQGNLLDNEHLALLDYLIAQAKQHGIYTVLTPIAWWSGAGETHGFSDLYSKAEMYVRPEALAAQRNYLRQFLLHRNRYTHLTYAEDPVVPVLEIINEPIPAPGTSDEVIVAYINTMYDAIRETGCRKPIFFNGWGGRLEAVGRSQAEGCTFGWYPTGLVAGRMLTANYLPLVDGYPDMRAPALRGKAKIVYEFDAADVPGSYIYPAMARSFRSGGAQIATQFQYDPLAIAPWNAGWQTHYLNLIYTPQKALSFAIAAEAFRTLPRLQTYGRSPVADRFGPFRVSYEEQLSQFADERTLMYSNDTSTAPPAPERLSRVWGCGSSPVVSYEGTGAYFLDRLGPKTWRLEVYPDCVWVDDPFRSVSLSREVARVYWRERVMKVVLPELGSDFAAVRVQPDRGGRQRAQAGTIRVRPGVYLLRGRGGPQIGEPEVPRFVAPPSCEGPPAVWHDPPLGVMQGRPLTLKATVAIERDPDAVTLLLQDPQGGPLRRLPLRAVAPYRYAVVLPAEVMASGSSLVYCLSVSLGDAEWTFPDPGARDAASRFLRREPVTVLRFDGNGPLPELQISGAPGETAKAEWAPGAVPGATLLRLSATGFGPPPSAAGARWPVLATGEALRGYNTLRVRARALSEKTTFVEVGCIQSDGQAYGCEVPLAPDFREFRIPIRRLRGLWGTREGSLQPEQLKEISVIFGSWLFPESPQGPHALEVEEVALEYQPPVWRVPIHAPGDPVTLFAPSEPLPGIISDLPHRQQILPGSTPDSSVWRLSVDRFGPPPSALGVRIDLSGVLAVRRGTLEGYDTLRLRARAMEPATNAVEIVLAEMDGTPWGTNAPLTTEWRDVRISLRELRFFDHWGSAPPGRGGEDDWLRLDNLASLYLTYGAWLYPDTADRRHGFEVELIELAKDR